MAYLAFALRHPALYEAMFILPTRLRFAAAQTRAATTGCLRRLAAAVTPFCVDVAVVTETFWAAFHGLAELERSGRITPSARVERITRVVRAPLKHLACSRLMSQDKQLARAERCASPCDHTDLAAAGYDAKQLS